MAFTYQAPQTDIARDTLPELMPVFSFLNSQSNKLYQEGYFLKLNDLDTRMFIILAEVYHGDANLLLRSRRPTLRRSKMDGMFCATCGNRTLVLGCRCPRRCWSGRGSGSHLHQPCRRFLENGKYTNLSAECKNRALISQNRSRRFRRGTNPPSLCRTS